LSLINFQLRSRNIENTINGCSKTQKMNVLENYNIKKMLVVGGLLLGQFFAHWWQQKHFHIKQWKDFGSLDLFKFSLNSQYGWGTRAILTMGDFQLRHHEQFPLTIQCHMLSPIVAIHIVSTLLQLVAITYKCCKFYIRDHDQYAYKILCDNRLIRWNLLPIKCPLPPYHLTNLGLNLFHPLGNHSFHTLN
jgi:hypothetical protein